MTSTEKLKLKTTIKLFGGTAIGIGYKLAESGRDVMSDSMLQELEDAMLPLVLHYNDLYVQLENLKIENTELKTQRGINFGALL